MVFIIFVSCSKAGKSDDAQKPSAVCIDGGIRCVGDNVEICEKDEWVLYSQCALNNQTCGMADGLAICVARPADSHQDETPSDDKSVSDEDSDRDSNDDGSDDNEPSGESAGDGDTGSDSDSDADGPAVSDSAYDSGSDSDTDIESDTMSDTDSVSPTESVSEEGTPTDTVSCNETHIDMEIPNLETSQVDILIVLDRSVYMHENGHWQPMGKALTDMIAMMEPGVHFGLETFPFTNDDCSPGEILVEIGPDKGAEIASLVGGGEDDVGYSLGAPTAASLVVAKSYLDTANDGRSKHVILATNGAPNCNDTLIGETCRCSTPDETLCDLEDRWCLDDQNTILAAEELNEAGYPVYVLGIGDENPWEDVLDAIASAGGTENHIVADADGFLTTMKQSVEDTVSCERYVDWDSLPDAMQGVSDTINLYCNLEVGDMVHIHERIPKDDGCIEGSGWRWSDDSKSRIRLCPGLCDKLKNGDCQEIEATQGCGA